MKKYKTLLGSISKNLNKQGARSCSRAGRLNILKISIYVKLMYIVNTIPKKNPNWIFFGRN